MGVRTAEDEKMVHVTFSDRAEAVATADDLLRGESLDCAVYVPRCECECFLVLDETGLISETGENGEPLLDYSPERRYLVRAPLYVS